MMKRPHSLEAIIYKALLLAISLILLLFMVRRAAEAAFTFDEAATYLNYISASPMAVFNFNSANNHIVNTILTKLTWTVGGSSEFVLRLPNLLSFAVYLLFSFLILDRFVKNKIIAVCGYLLLSLNPYVLDFFSLCRGYGLSLAFLMASLFFFFSFLEKVTKNKPDRYRPLNFSLAAAGVAVLCNFSLLNVYISLAIIAFVFFAVRNRRDRRHVFPLEEPPVNPSGKKKFFLPILVLLAVLFNLLVICQDFTLAQKFFEPVIVRIAGPSKQEKQNVVVFRIDVKNQETRLIYEDDLWKMDKPAYFTAVKFRFPSELLNKIQRIEIRIGPKTFSLEAHELLKLKNDRPHKKYFTFYSNYSVSLKRSLIPVFKPVVNWKGDGSFLPYFLLRLLIVLGLYALALITLTIIRRVLARWKILDRDQLRPLVSTTMLLASFIGYPLYLLKRSGALYWGGRTGFIRDTVFSLINNSFYGNLYFRKQEWVVFFFICLVLAASLVLLIAQARKRSLAGVLPGLSVFTILVVVSMSTIVQRVLFDNPYLIGRTGLYLIPLFTLLLIFLFHKLAVKGVVLKAISISVLAVVAVLAFTHFVEQANTALTVEWRSDADIKELLKDLKMIKDKDFSQRPRISLGIDENFYPCLAYYEKRGTAAWLEFHIVPPDLGYDFYYFGDTVDRSEIILVKSYPRSGNLLAKAKNE